MESVDLKGEVYEVSSQIAYCENCGSEIWVDAIHDANLKALYDTYRQRHDIICLEDIKAIPEKYNIGKRPLSLLLGWGEQTFSRFYEGDMPSKEYSEKLKRIHSDPSYYLTILENGRENLKSRKAYEKSMFAVNRLLNVSGTRKSKLEDYVDYLLFQCQDMTHLSLQKALYYTQGFYYAFYGGFLFDEDCEAWVHGPVYRDIYKRYCGYWFDPIDSVDEPDVSSMSGEETALLESIVRQICCYSGKTLESFTHTETPWLLARGNLPADAPSDKIIDKRNIGEYFSLVKQKYHMLSPANIKDYTKDMLSQI
jgi:uncharacterized phage-associated protein